MSRRHDNRSGFSASSKLRRWRRGATGVIAEPLEARQLLSSYAAGAYFPLVPGNTWAYAGTTDLNLAGTSTSAAATSTLTSIATTLNGAAVTALTNNIVAIGGNQTSVASWFSYSPSAGVYFYGQNGNEIGSSGNITLSLPVQIMTPTMTDGQVLSWSNVGITAYLRNTAASGTDTGNSTVQGMSPVTASNGATYQALVVVINQTESYSGAYLGVHFTAAGTNVQTLWLTAGLGIVQMTDAINLTISAEGLLAPVSYTDSFSLASNPLQPTVTGVSPAAGLTAGGTAVTITGTNLANATVAFGGTSATILSDTATQIIASSPAAAPGTVDVTVATGNGTSIITTADQFTYSNPSSISGTVDVHVSGGEVATLLAPQSDVMVYLDANNDGKLDAGDISVTTDANGDYTFNNLVAGTYTIREVVPGGYVAVSPSAPVSITVNSGAFTGGNFVNAPSSTATAEAVYRLYSPVTLEHLYTSDPNEYNTLEQYTGTWIGEGQVFNEYSDPIAFGHVADVPLYRLYDAADKQHFWTDDYNEYNTLRSAPWNWSDEGIVGYVFPTAVAGHAATPLYELTAPQVHLWTTDLNEYDILASAGWTQAGVIGYVM